MLWTYIDVWHWERNGWAEVLLERRFEQMSPHFAAGTFDGAAFAMRPEGLARWFSYDKGRWVAVTAKRTT